VATLTLLASLLVHPRRPRAQPGLHRRGIAIGAVAGAVGARAWR
jgi:hypothetical protein